MSSLFIVEDSEDAKWVDLILNPEKFTGYTGQGANRIWIAIYKENCFLPEKRMKTFAELQSVFLSKTCLEKRVFYRTMSGLHASINIDLSYNSLITDPRFPSKPQWGPDLDDFERRFDPVATKGNGTFLLLFILYLCLSVFLLFYFCLCGLSLFLVYCPRNSVTTKLSLQAL